ncbi:methyl-accepting chemotaxis protein [Undibacterium sp. Ren11W]|uniref:methyl-accepting chemotaxis protein n=1 Tax=Undibacterium sp. Ren11W TaxID=3413045 RepID=UPI003BF1409A
MSKHDQLLSLHRAVSINESLKQVIEISGQINIVAMNAILIAKRAGPQSAGFRVVAMELRLFSQKIEELMGFLGGLIFHLVHRVAELRKLEKRLSLLSHTMSKNTESEQRLTHSFQQKRTVYTEKRELAQTDWEQLEKEIRRSVALCSAGSMLSHNGRIEAAYGGNMLADMQQVAGRIEDIMGQVITTLKHLNATLRSES